jgi:hypothetical protein
MRGSDQVTGALFGYVDLEERIPARRPLRKIRAVVNDALRSLDAEFSQLYAGEGRPSIAPERLIRASLLQILYSIRSERQLRTTCDWMTASAHTCQPCQAQRMTGLSSKPKAIILYHARGCCNIDFQGLYRSIMLALDLATISGSPLHQIGSIGDNMPDPARGLNANVPGWRGLQPSEKKAIRDFAVLWSFFELNSTWRYGRPDASPRNIARAVGDLAHDPNIDRFELARVYFAARYIDGEDYTQHWNHLRIHPEYVARARLGLVGEDRNSRDTFLALLLIANRLRNNFLHGEKARYNFAGQYNNFTHANTLLIYALELWPNPQDG